MTSDAGELYFLGEIDPFTGARSPFVKIGLVRENANRGTAHRLKEHQTGNPREIAELHVLTTSEVEKVETAMHGIFATHRIGGEWFRLEGDLLDTAISRASSLAAEMSRSEAALLEAAALDKVESTGEKRPSTREIDGLLRAFALAKLTLKVASDAEGKVKDTFLALDADGADVGRFVTVQEKVKKAAFEKTRFAKEHPTIYERFVTTSPTISGRFTPTTAAKLGLGHDDLPTDLVRLAESISSLVEQDNTVRQKPGMLHSKYLEMLQFSAPVKFSLTLMEAELKLACGRAPGIEGVCTWNRTVGETTTFDQSAFAAAHPDLLAEYMKPASLSTSVVVAKDLGYRL